MKVLVDTCVWSQVLRHKSPNQELTLKLKDLIADGRVSIIGPIRQELLSGISKKRQFNELRKKLSPFKGTTLRTEHFVKAAEFCNTCRKNGVQGSTIDFLICAVANIEKQIIFTTDKDFENYVSHLPIEVIS